MNYDDSVTVDFNPADYPGQFELVTVRPDGTRVYRPVEIDGCGGCENGECCGACECCSPEGADRPIEDDLLGDARP